MFSCKISSCKSAGRFNVQPGTTADKITDVEANKQKPTSVPLSPEPASRQAEAEKFAEDGAGQCLASLA
jgi:hypothetical protein